MNNFEEVFEYLKDNLINWKYKDTTPNVSGEGFNDHNVMEIVGTLPAANIFDYVFIQQPLMNNTNMTTGNNHIQKSTQTYTIEVYCKRGGTGNAMKRATQKALLDNVSFITNLFANIGFIISVSPPNLRHLTDDTARQVITITKTFIS